MTPISKGSKTTSRDKMAEKILRDCVSVQHDCEKVVEVKCGVAVKRHSDNAATVS